MHRFALNKDIQGSANQAIEVLKNLRLQLFLNKVLLDLEN